MRYLVTAINPNDPGQWEQSILTAESKQAAELAMTARLPEERKHWTISGVGDVSPYADEAGSTHGE